MKYIADLAERVASTYAVTFLGLLLANGFDLTDVSSLKAAAIASVPAALTVLKGFLAGFVGDKNSAGFTDVRDR